MRAVPLPGMAPVFEFRGPTLFRRSGNAAIASLRSFSTHWAPIAAIVVVGCNSGSPGADLDNDELTSTTSVGGESDTEPGAASSSTNTDSVDADGSTSGTTGRGTETDGGDATAEGSGASSGTPNDSSDGGLPPDSDVVIFLNFEGITLTEGPDDSSLDQTEVGLLVGEHQPFEGDSEPVLEGVSEFWSDFGVAVTDERPASGDYTMVVVGAPGPALDATALDCGNANSRSVAAVFEGRSMGAGFPAFLVGKINHQIGWSLGLETVTNRTDFMNFPRGSASVNMCVPIQSEPSCPRVHAQHCPAGEQNSYAEVVAAVST